MMSSLLDDLATYSLTLHLIQHDIFFYSYCSGKKLSSNTKPNSPSDLLETMCIFKLENT